MTSHFSRLSSDYLARFQIAVMNARASGSTSVEMATRPVVHDFIEELIQLSEDNQRSCVVHHDTTTAGGDRPDWRLEDSVSFGIYAYGDQKSLSDRGPLTLSPAEEEQMLRYLSLGRPVFVFDGIEFVFLDPTSRRPILDAIRVSLIPKPLLMSEDWASAQIDPLVEIRFREILSRPGFRKWTESQLIELLAVRARLISATIKGLLDAPSGSGRDLSENRLLDALQDLQRLLAAHHDPTLSSVDSCADFVAQVLIFGLFYAHTRSNVRGTSPDERRQVIGSFWTDDSYLEVAQKIRPFHAIATTLSGAMETGNDLELWYRDASLVLAHAEYLGTESSPTDFHTLYERFLSTFSPEIRFDFGAFFTPKSLANWMIRFADSICDRAFGFGLKGSTEKVIDPCVGTGSLLEAFIEVIGPEIQSPPELIGFEILPAPYALAQYRLAQAVADTPFRDRVHLLLTDTLADQLFSPPFSIENDFDQELVEAATFVRPPLRFVVGNPPSTVGSVGSAPRSIINEQMEDFRPPFDLRTDRQNIQKAINNEAYRFLRWCAGQVLLADKGVLALVLPGSFVYAISLRYAREWLANQFEEVWILELDGDARTGAGTDSIFNVLQGRAIVFAIHGSTNRGIFHADITSRSLQEKVKFLEDPIELNRFESIDGDPGQFAPRVPYNELAWKKSWPLTSCEGAQGLFRMKCSGIKLAPTGALFHSERSQLIRRAKAIATSPRKSYVTLKSEWFAGQARPPAEAKLSLEVRDAIGMAMERESESIVPYTYRPFLQGMAIIDDGVFGALSSTPGGGARTRPEIRAAFQQGAIALAIAPGPRDLGASLTRFVSFCWHLPDNDNAARGNAMIYCDRYAATGAGRKNWDDNVVMNVNSDFTSLFSSDDNPGQAAVFYLYAVMSTPSYLEAFEPVLYSGSNPSKPHRVPVVKDASVRSRLASLGMSIALCESMDWSVGLSNELVIEWPEAVTEFELIGFGVDDDAGTITLKGRHGEFAYLKGASALSLTERIAGHHVIGRWLRERTFPYLRRTFRPSDLEALCDLVSRLEAQRQLIEEADEIVNEFISDISAITPPTLLS